MNEFKVVIDDDNLTINVADTTNTIGDYVVGVIKILDGDGDIVYKNEDYDTPEEIVSPDIIVMETDNVSKNLPVDSNGEIIRDTYNVSYKTNTGVTASTTAVGSIVSTGATIVLVDAGLTATIIEDIRKLGVLSITSGALAGNYTLTSASFVVGTTTATFVLNESIAAVSTYAGNIITYLSVTTTSYSYDFVYDPVFPEVSIDMTINYLNRTLLVEDKTNYTALNNGAVLTEVTSRLMTISPPTGATYSTYTTTNSAKQLFNIWTNIYQATVVTSAVYTVSTSYDILKELDGSDYIKVENSACTCEILDCLNTLYSKYVNYLSTNPSLARETQEAIIKVSYNINLYNRARECGEDTEQYCLNIQAILKNNDCNCEIGTTDSASVPLSTSSLEIPNSVFVVSGTPLSSLGEDGDIAFSDDKNVYVKENNVWVLSLTYNETTFVNGVPSYLLGNDGDICFSDNNNIYKKVNGAWESKMIYSEVLTGVGTPSALIGNDGDIFLSDAKKVYTKAAGVWSVFVDYGAISANIRTYQVTYYLDLAANPSGDYVIPFSTACTLQEIKYYAVEDVDKACTLDFNIASVNKFSEVLNTGLTIGAVTTLANFAAPENIFAPTDSFEVRVVTTLATGIIVLILTIENNE